MKPVMIKLTSGWWSDTTRTMRDPAPVWVNFNNVLLIRRHHARPYTEIVMQDQQSINVIETPEEIGAMPGFIY